MVEFILENIENICNFAADLWLKNLMEVLFSNIFLIIN